LAFAFALAFAFGLAFAFALAFGAFFFAVANVHSSLLNKGLQGTTN
jgi:hypothetical protein